MSTFNLRTGRPHRKPVDKGIFLHIHDHEWEEHGTYAWPSGDIEPVWRCRRCGDIMCSPAAKENS